MIQSMTGFGSAVETFSSKAAKIEIHCEIKTLNSKFIDIQIRSPKAFMNFDPEISRLVKNYLRRGRVDIHISRQVLEGSTQDLRVNFTEASRLYSALQDLQERLGIQTPIQLNDLLQAPDWLHTSEVPVDLEEERSFCLQVVEKALQKVIESRKQEGENLYRSFLEHRSELEKVFLEIEAHQTKILGDLKERASQRIRELLGDKNFDPQRLEQEMIYWISRSDFREEVDRFRYHLKTFDELMKSGGELGRRVEFLVQEMHRELNTMGSKCGDPKWTPRIIEMKALVERIREQTQNIE